MPEPNLIIGILLPEDHKTELSFSFTNPAIYTINSNEHTTISPGSSNSSIVRVHNGNVSLESHGLLESKISLIRHSESFDNNGILLKGIPAGRGFHWEKEISVCLPGNIEISVIKNSLFVTNILPLEQYLSCVAVSEMSSACPPSFLQAQTITARSWILAATEKKHESLGLNACNDDCCQRYQGLSQTNSISKKAASLTRGIVLTYKDSICDTRYSKSCGGKTERKENVWGGPPVPYLRSIKDTIDDDIAYCSPEIVPEEELKTYIGTVDEKGQYYRWSFEATQTDLINSLQNHQYINAKEISNLIPITRGDSGRIISLDIQFLDENGESQSLILQSEYDIRKMLSPSFLYSSAFTPLKKDDNNFLLNGKGWGHGVGLCQIGALGMALRNHSSSDILRHYFPLTKETKLY